MRNILYLLMLVIVLASCLGEEDYTTSPTDRLTFSKDTIRFDTIISATPTRTRSFTVYNRASKAIRIPQVSLKSGASSPFQINVDGTSLSNGVATDFEIASKDSMIVYLMANVPHRDVDNPIAYSDELRFLTEAGVEQSVTLEASGQDVVTLRGRRITEDETLSAARPYRVMDSLVVEKGTTLTLAAGTRFLFHSGATLRVYGTLRVEGTLERPVTLRGDRLDDMFLHQPYDRTPGLWGGVEIMPGSYANVVRYADIHSGNYGIKVDSTDVTHRALTIENSQIHTVTDHALDVRMANVFVGNTLLANAGGDCLHVRGGDLSLVHCTLARFYVFTSGYGHAMDFANYSGDVRLPLHHLSLTNCIVTGYQDDEMMGTSNADHEEDAFDYTFNHCLIATPEPDTPDEHFTECLWDVVPKGEDADAAIVREKNFAKEFNLDYISFSFLLSPKSKAVGTADSGVTSTTYPSDLMGQPRGEKPDMGCYQHQEENEPTEEHP